GAIGAWTSWSPSPFDVPRVRRGDRDERFVESLGGGLFAELLVLAEERERRRGEAGTPEEGLALLRRLVLDAEPRQWEIDLDGERVDGDHLAVEVMNIRRVGPGVQLAPMADPADGLVDVVLLSDDDRAAFVDLLDAMCRG